MKKSPLKKIPMVDLHRQYKSIKKEIDCAIFDVIKESGYINSRFVKKLEQEIAEYCKIKYAVGVNSGTDALYLSLWALGIKQGDEVITTPFTFIATAEVIVLLEARPVFVDVDYETYNIDADLIEKKITKKTKAIIPVHLFGFPYEMDKIKKIAKKHNLFLIEDAAQAIGAEYNGKRIGSFGNTGCFSFFPSKNLGAYGDGGIIITDSKKLAERLKILRNHGSKIKYFNEEIGVSSRLDGIQASILSVKLKHLDKWNRKRREMAELYNSLLKNINWIGLPKENKSCNHVYNQYTIRVKNGKRDKLKKYLEKKGISSMIYYPLPLHLTKAMRYLGYKKGSFPVSEKLSKQVLSLPISADLKKEEVKYIVDVINRFTFD